MCLIGGSVGVVKPPVSGNAFVLDGEVLDDGERTYMVAGAMLSSGAALGKLVEALASAGADGGGVGAGALVGGVDAFV
jgi:hypothetical protein